MTPEIINYDQRPELWQRFPEVFTGILPEYNLHGDVLDAGYWERLHEIFGLYQLVLLGPDDEIWATARGIPTSWDGTPVGLGPGLDAAIEAAFALHDAGGEPNTLCALGIEVAPRHQGAGLGTAMLQALRATAREAGFGQVIVPARPTWKDRYPLVAIERYAHWTTDGGLPFDPWLRTQVRAGGELSVPTSRSSLITGTVTDWESWTGMRFPDSDDYVIPGGLATVRIDRDADLGTYWEPSVWVVHEGGPRAGSVLMSTALTPLRLGVVGCGAVTELCHLPALAGGTPFRLTALVDRVPEHAERAAEQHRLLRKAKGLDQQTTPLCATDVTDVLDAIDVAIVATAPVSHAMLAIQLAAAGKHVRLEKPIAATVGECVAIRDASASTGITVLSAHVRRFYPMADWVAQRLASGELGTVRRVHWREGLEYGWPAVTGFTFEAGAGGGVLADLGPHVLDLLGYWFGPLELQRCKDNSAGGADSEARLALQAGTTGIEVELSRLRNLGNTVTIEATEATLRVETGRVAGYQWWTGDGVLLEQGLVPASLPATLTREGLFHHQLGEFDRALRGQPNAAATFAEATATVKLLEHCRERRVHTLTRPWESRTSTSTRHNYLAGVRRVAVTGATGFIGSHVVEQLLREDATSVVALARTLGKQARQSHADRARLDLVRADLPGGPAALMKAFSGCDVVVHAAYGNMGESALRWAVTVEGTAAVLAAASKAGVRRLVHLSSLSVYDAAAGTMINEDSSLLETDPKDLSYGQQKLAAERLVFDLTNDQMEVVCVQPTVVYGPWGPLWTVCPLHRLAEDNTALLSGPSGPCDVVHVHDVADAITFLAAAPGACGRRFLVSGPRSTTWGQFYDYYRDMLSLPRLSLPDSADWAERDRRFYAGAPVDTSRLAGLSFRSRIDLDSGMDHLACWARWARLA